MLIFTWMQVGTNAMFADLVKLMIRLKLEEEGKAMKNAKNWISVFCATIRICKVERAILKNKIKSVFKVKLLPIQKQTKLRKILVASHLL